MNRVHGEAVNVRAREDGRPARFVWRGRLYTVRAILEHWVITREAAEDPRSEPGQPDLEFWRVEAAPGSAHDGRGLRTAPGSRHQCLGCARAMTYPHVVDILRHVGRRRVQGV